MLIEIDFESDIPIYEQLKRQLIEGIASGNLKSGDNLPSVRHMAEDIGINLHTVNKAYNELKSEGYLNIDRRKGAVINSDIPKDSKELNERLEDELKYLIARANLNGADERDFLRLCSDIFKKYNKSL
ncbi:GntR family transcriptional regulator [Clostridium tyrobutyricum]|uniref:GntR family transcriptional regulator n=1 Tax=Clostridium tyrobutyricum TaxID=1519 RepID=UPI001C394F84|nr:GntR family transcriptional regulator [Clostridium tyrobutyricum]MBV4446857.1 GntR family transcriptional regulator [Clostridium tyrobutyricum]